MILVASAARVRIVHSSSVVIYKEQYEGVFKAFHQGFSRKAFYQRLLRIFDLNLCSVVEHRLTHICVSRPFKVFRNSVWMHLLFCKARVGSRMHAFAIERKVAGRIDVLNSFASFTMSSGSWPAACHILSAAWNSATFPRHRLLDICDHYEWLICFISISASCVCSFHVMSGLFLRFLSGSSKLCSFHRCFCCFFVRSFCWMHDSLLPWLQNKDDLFRVLFVACRVGDDLQGDHISQGVVK